MLLPNSRVPEGTKIGSELEVFIYRDSEDRQIATLSEPALTIGGLARLKVVQVTKIGAFLSWGLEKDLFLPYAQQTYRVNEGDEILVTMYADKSDRLCAKMDVYKSLLDMSPYKKDDTVTGTLYLISNNFGAFVAVDNCYLGLIPKNEMVRNFRIGDAVEARIKEIREDGKMNLSVREKAYVQMDIDSSFIMEKLEMNRGYLPYHDKSSPEDIKEFFSMSKNEYKRAIGRLYKKKKIRIESDGIYKL